MTTSFEAVTREILVRVQPVYLPAQSVPEQGWHVWAYHVTLINQGARTVQLLRRTWRITDAQARVQLVQGDGVVGEQPVLRPGQTHAYSSGTKLNTASGFMTGQYHMIDLESGALFDIAIPALCATAAQ